MALCLGLAGASLAHAAPLPRVASLGVCTDQLVLALAVPEQIVSLSAQATDPYLSWLAEAAAPYPRNRGTAEEVLAAGAEVVLGEAGLNTPALSLLRRLGVTTHAVGLTDDLAVIDAETLRVAALIGRLEAGQALVARGRDLYRALQDTRPSRAPIAVYLQPGGGSAGQGTFVNTLMEVVGLSNLTAALGRSGWGRLDLEVLQTHPPERLVLSSFDNGAQARLTALGRHPVFRRLSATTPVTVVEGRAWVCSSWILSEAARQLARARAPEGGGGLP
ncbi:ABC transporter substrate-binding protein [Pararhodospirillum photometricum]|uniref:ABC transporter substrate-binding protein n=1 Tax=Pararhodospirillum photometricum TaxID=1084 RepID=UPI0002D6907C|nr:ABC transporter substrate-binding protein [Pararhodospirillum photometricum]